MSKTIPKKITWIFITICFSTTCFSQNWDVDILKNIQHTRTSGMNSFMKGVSFSAYIMAPVVPLSILATGLVTSNCDASIAGLQIGAGILLSTATTIAIKSIVKRERPYDAYPDILHPIQRENSYSFPSNHTSVAFATATSLSLQFRKWYVTLPAFLWATTVAYSRMYLGVHYASDVFIGLLVGIGTAYLSYKIQQWIAPKVHIPVSIRF